MTSLTIIQTGFDSLGLHTTHLESLDRLGFLNPTPIQHQAIPPALEGRDIIGIAQTGSGKTLAFGLPMVQRLAGTDDIGLVMVPTRELAQQVDETLSIIAGPFGMRTAVLIGGAAIGPQIRQLEQRPRLIVATPGRLLDHLEQKTISLTRATVVVLDEADRMLDMGFAPQIHRVMRRVPRERQTMLFSATMPTEIARISAQYLHDPERIEVAPPGTRPEEITQELFVIEQARKPQLLERLLTRYQGTVLVFTRTRYGARKLTRNLKNAGHRVGELHSDRTQTERRAALDGFRNGAYRVLVATDIAARGLDVEGIELVVNYDLPDNPEDYVHRIGRTGRAGRAGHAVSLATPEQGQQVWELEMLLNQQLPMADESALPVAVRPESPPPPPPKAQPQPRQAEAQAQVQPEGEAPARRRRRRRRPQSSPPTTS